MKALCESSPQARCHFTRLDQVHQLVTAREAIADTGFMARLLTLCSLPRTNPGNQLQYKRVNGPYSSDHDRWGSNQAPLRKLPPPVAGLGVVPKRCGLRSRELVLGSSLSEFMRKLGMDSRRWRKPRRPHAASRNQMRRLFNSSVRSVYEDELKSRPASIHSVASRTEFWWNESKSDEPSLWDSQDSNSARTSSTRSSVARCHWT